MIGLPAPCRALLCARGTARATTSVQLWRGPWCRHQSSGDGGGEGPHSTVTIDEKPYPTDSWFNAPQSILSCVTRRLHLQQAHPLSITRQLIETRFPNFKFHNDLFPVVTTGQNFDSLGFPADHSGRSKTDTYYINEATVLRTHTSAHQADVFRDNTSDGFLISADVYRRDAIDRSHYPVFHQMEGARTWSRDLVPSGQSLAEIIRAEIAKMPAHHVKVEDPNPTIHPGNPLQDTHGHTKDEVEAIAAHLKRTLEDVVVTIFSHAQQAAASGGPESDSPTDSSTRDPAFATTATAQKPLHIRWVEAYFPFTSPSWELEVYWQGDWLEVLGCGVVQQPILNTAGVPDQIGWAFGLGLERIAMLLYEIPDIRLFWSTDSRFLSQFSEPGVAPRGSGERGEYSSKRFHISRFTPFSKHPACYKDVAFWLPESKPTNGHSPITVKKDPAASGPFENPGMRLSEQTTDAEQQPPPRPNPAGGLISASQLSVHENDVHSLIRDIAGTLAEEVKRVDEFTHPKTGRKSQCYRINYRSLERTLTNEEVNELHEKVRQALQDRLNVTLR